MNRGPNLRRRRSRPPPNRPELSLHLSSLATISRSASAAPSPALVLPRNAPVPAPPRSIRPAVVPWPVTRSLPAPSSPELHRTPPPALVALALMALLHQMRGVGRPLHRWNAPASRRKLHAPSSIQPQSSSTIRGPQPRPLLDRQRWPALLLDGPGRIREEASV
jgi:hypothetical protein